MKYATLYIFGLIFGLGISISGMANPAKVLNFFDVAGTWDPSLAFVMGGALITTMIGYAVVLKRPAPTFGEVFHIPNAKNIDMRLIGGSAVFGVGWGLSGFCPGGVLPVLGTGRVDVILFVVAMLAGILAARSWIRRSAATAATS